MLRSGRALPTICVPYRRRTKRRALVDFRHALIGYGDGNRARNVCIPYVIAQLSYHDVTRPASVPGAATLLSQVPYHYVATNMINRYAPYWSVDVVYMICC